MMQEKKSEQKLDPEQAALQLEDPSSFLEEATEALHIMSARGIIVWANKKELELLGYNKDEYIGHHISEFFTDRFAINDILCRLVYNNEVANYPAELRKKDGSTLQVLLNSNVYSRGGEFVHARCSTRDITDLKLIQTRTETSNARILNQLITSNNLINLMTSTSWKTDYQGHITENQTRWQAYTKQAVQDQIGYGWLKPFHPEDRIKIKSNLVEAIKNNHDFRQIARVYCPLYESYIYCGIYATPLSTFDGKEIEWSFILIDQTKNVPTEYLPT